MAIQQINTGAAPNDKTGDTARAWAQKTNSNFTNPDHAASKLMATDSQVIAGTPGVIPDAEQVRKNHVAQIEDVQSMIATSAAFDGQQISLTGYHPGSGVGGGLFYCGTDRHDGIKSFDPSRSFPSDWSNLTQLNSWFLDSGVDAQCWIRSSFNGVADVKQAGCKPAGDVAYFINLINSKGYDCKVSESYTQSTEILVDLYKGSLVGESDAIITTDLATASNTDMLTVFSSADYTTRPLVNPRKKISGISFDFKALGNAVLGGAAYPESSEMLFESGSFVAPYRVIIDENAWRSYFFRWPIVRAENKILYYNASPNAGEVMQFDHGWFVDSKGDWDLTDGQWVFNGCSLPAGSPVGFQSTFALKGNANAVFNGSNIEYQPGQYWVLFYLTGSTRLRLAGSNVTISATDPFDRPIALINDDGVMSLEGCSLPLYGDYLYETNASVRELIGGTSNKIQSRGCYPRAGAILTNWDKMAVVSHKINSVSNPSGQLGDTSSWTSVPYGPASGSVVVSSVVASPNTLVFDHSLRIQAPVNAGCAFSQQIPLVEPGRYFQFGFWAKSDLGQTYATISFLRKDGGTISSNAYLIDAATTTAWRWLALIDVCPPESHSVKIEFNAQEVPNTDIYIHHVIYGLI